jgi:hypothetical protein
MTRLRKVVLWALYLAALAVSLTAAAPHVSSYAMVPSTNTDTIVQLSGSDANMAQDDFVLQTARHLVATAWGQMVQEDLEAVALSGE